MDEVSNATSRARSAAAEAGMSLGEPPVAPCAMTRPPATRHGLALVLAALLAGAAVRGAPTGSAPQPDDPPRVSEHITVTETSILLELPRLKPSVAERLGPADFEVAEDGQLRQVLRITPLDEESEPWRILVFVDALLTQRDGIRRAAEVLAEQADALAELGEVAIVLSANERRHGLLEATRDPAAIRAGFEELAATEMGIDLWAEVQRQLGAESDADRLAVMQRELLRERLDALIVTAADRCPFPPCLLLHVSNGFDTGELDGRADSPALVALQEETASLLSALGWTSFGLALRPPDEGPDPRRESPDPNRDFDEWKRGTPGVQMQPLWTSRRDTSRFDHLPPEILEIYTEPRLRPLLVWAQTTVGTVIRVPEQLAYELGRLDHRWWLHFRTEPAAPGALRELSVKIAENSPFRDSLRRRLAELTGFAPEKEPLRYVRWTRFSVPAAVDAARLRLAASRGAGDALSTRSAGDFVLVGDGLWWRGGRRSALLRIGVLRGDEASFRVLEVPPRGLEDSVESRPGAPSEILLADTERGWLAVTDLGAGETAILHRPR